MYIKYISDESRGVSIVRVFGEVSPMVRYHQNRNKSIVFTLFPDKISDPRDKNNVGIYFALPGTGVGAVAFTQRLHSL